MKKLIDSDQIGDDLQELAATLSRKLQGTRGEQLYQMRQRTQGMIQGLRSQIEGLWVL